jgi:hypothetical protein
MNYTEAKKINETLDTLRNDGFYVKCNGTSINIESEDGRCWDTDTNNVIIKAREILEFMASVKPFKASRLRRK